MKTNTFKKIASFVMALIVVCATVFVQPQTAKAANDYVNILHKVSTAEGNTPIDYNFSLAKKSDIFFIIRTNERTGVTITVREPGHDAAISSVVLAETNPDWAYHKDTGIYQNTAGIKLNPGKYILELKFDIGVNYDVSMNQVTPAAKLAKTNIAITKGFTDSIKVTGGYIRSCSSSNKSVATVTNKGKITAKKLGKATINVTLTDGKVLKCKVTVKKNVYTAKKITVNSTIFNTYDMKAYRAQFDAKGNLVVKFKIVDNSSGKITSIPNFKITVKNAKKHTTVSYKLSSYHVTVKSFNSKDCTITIPKSCFKERKDKIDLRTSKIVISGKSARATF